MLIALAQAKVTTNLERNYEHFTELLERASRKGADLICFPELFPSSVPPFFDEPEELAERYDINLIAGFEEEGYNVCKVFSREGKCIGVQRKVYTARSERYKCGKSWKVFNIEGVKVGIVICSSLWRPEPASILREKGVDIIFNPSRLYAFLAKWWEHVLVCRSLENVLPLVGVNISNDFQWGSTYWAGGGSKVIVPIPPETMGRSFAECLEIEEPISVSSLTKLSMKKGETLSFCKLTKSELDAFKKYRNVKFG